MDLRTKIALGLPLTAQTVIMLQVGFRLRERADGLRRKLARPRAMGGDTARSADRSKARRAAGRWDGRSGHAEACARHAVARRVAHHFHERLARAEEKAFMGRDAAAA